MDLVAETILCYPDEHLLRIVDSINVSDFFRKCSTFPPEFHVFCTSPVSFNPLPRVICFGWGRQKYLSFLYIVFCSMVLAQLRLWTRVKFLDTNFFIKRDFPCGVGSMWFMSISVEVDEQHHLIRVRNYARTILFSSVVAIGLIAHSGSEIR